VVPPGGNGTTTVIGFDGKAGVDERFEFAEAVSLFDETA
jgi:hypothetical protein